MQKILMPAHYITCLRHAGLATGLCRWYLTVVLVRRTSEFMW